MIIRSKAPLRIGLAGGGTDVSPFCDIYGGYVLNATINMYARCTIEPWDDKKVVFNAVDRNEVVELDDLSDIKIEGDLILHKGVYKRIVNEYNGGKPLYFKMTTSVDAPAGSGLGSSSTLTVAIIKAYVEWLDLPLGDYEIARLAYEIERIDCKLSGGKQDQYAAAFGGFNFMEFYSDDKVIVNPLRIKNWSKNELEESIVLYYTGTSRDSANIIDEQVKNTVQKNEKSIDSMKELKIQAVHMKEAVLKSDFLAFADCIYKSWLAKKQMASSITNSKIDEAYEYAIDHGAKAAKISGAGGGGFMMIIVDPVKRKHLVEALKKLDGEVMEVTLTEKGAQAWRLY